MKSRGWSPVLTHHKPTPSNNTESKLENAFIQFKELLIHVKLLPQVSNIIGSLIWEYYMNLFVVMFVWIGSLKQINIISIPQYGCFQIVSTHTSLSFPSPLGFRQVMIRILPWQLISPLLCHVFLVPDSSMDLETFLSPSITVPGNSHWFWPLVLSWFMTNWCQLLWLPIFKDSKLVVCCNCTSLKTLI